MIKTIYYLNGKTQTDLTLEEVKNVLLQKQGVLWVDLVQTPYKESEDILLN